MPVLVVAVNCVSMGVREKIGSIRKKEEGAVSTADPESSKAKEKEEGDDDNISVARSSRTSSGESGFFLIAATFPFQGGLEEEAPAAGITGGMRELSAAVAYLSKVTFLSLGAEGAAK